MNPSWGQTHAALPSIAALDGTRASVIFSARDASNRAAIALAHLNLEGSPDPVIEPRPLLTAGPRGAFDDAGVTNSCLVSHRGRLHLYYSGWSLGASVPFYFYIGCAVSEDGGRHFERVSPAPILERNAVDPYLTASPAVIVESGVWRMWYVSGTGWRSGSEPCYHIRYAESRDGIAWRRVGLVAIDYKDAAEHCHSRPCVIRDGDTYRMWFSARGDVYRLAYAESTDGLTWRRRDEATRLDLAPVGWDSEMICYPWVFDAGGVRRMLYNGNGYGRTGFGQATGT